MNSPLPSEQFSAELADLYALSENALQRGTERVLAYCLAEPDNRQVVVMEPHRLPQNRREEVLVELDRRDTTADAFLQNQNELTAELTVRHGLGLISMYTGEEEHARNFHIVSRNVGILALGSDLGGSVDKVEVYDEDSAEFASMTTIQRRHGGALETLILASREDQIDGVVVTSSLETGEEAYEACIQMFGRDSLAAELFMGNFETLRELSEGVEIVRSSALEAGVYPQEQVDAMLEIIFRHATFGGLREEEVTAEVIERFAQFTASLAPPTR